MYPSTKETILCVYDGAFRATFDALYAAEYAAAFRAQGLHYEHRLIDDMVAFALKSGGGFLWAAKNYDGDVQSDVVAQGFGSLGLMTSMLLDPTGRVCETEAAHGTVSRHYRAHLAGRATSTNSIASIFAWSGGLRHRAHLDGNAALRGFADTLEASVRRVVEVDGVMTRDLALCVHGEGVRPEDYVDTWAFLDAVARALGAAVRG